MSFSLALLAAAALLSIGIALRLCAARRERGKFARELDRLRDEVWELREVASARERAEAANEAKSRFLATVSHEVRTPLNGILGMAELLTGTTLSAEQETYVAAIRSSSNALASLVDEILDFAKIEAGKLELASETFDLHRLVESVVELLAPRAHGKGLEIAGTFAAEVPRRVEGDPSRLRQILLNLAGNAVKFTDVGGLGLRIDLADAACGLIRFEVADTGPGVPVDRRAAIFEDFEQADSSVTRRHSGTGLGLAISKRLAERMGGSLELADGPDGLGSRFVLNIPLPAARPTEAMPRVDLQGHRILVAANSRFEAPFMAERLIEAGATAVLASTAAEAFRRLERDAPYDTVILDCALGTAPARDLAAFARRHGANRAIVLFSPFERRALDAGTAQGFDGWLVKPVRRQSLLALLASPREPAIRLAKAGDSSRPVAAFRVLLAEDNEINALLAACHLRKLGAAVTAARDGQSALALARSALEEGCPYDILLFDLRMPNLDGLELAARVRAAEREFRAPRARLLILSADLRDAERRVAERNDVDVLIPKPFSFAQLAEALGPIVQPARELALGA